MEYISGLLFNFLLICFKLVLNPVLGITGICTNVINIAVFYKMGLSDGVTQNFFILSISDGLFATVAFCNSMSYITLRIIKIYVGYHDFKIKAQIFYWSTYLALVFPQYISLVTTVVIAVVRCCCVAIPLKVKYLITTGRQLAVILILSGSSMIILIYVFAGTYTIYVHNPTTNSSIAHITGIRWSVLNAVNNIAFCGSFIVVIICVIILSISLGKASRFRSAGTAPGETSTSRDHKDSVDGKSKERQRDARIVRTVVLVSVVFIICNIPPIVYYALKLLIQDLAPSGKYKNANQFSLMINEMFTLFNVILNMFIYVLYNTRYRTTLLAMIGSIQSQENTN